MHPDTEPFVSPYVAPARRSPRAARRRPRPFAAITRRLRGHRDKPTADVAPVTDPTPAEPSVVPPTALDSVDWNRWYPALIWFAAGVVAVTFALSYHGLYEFAHKIVGLPFLLALMVPVGVDVFSLCCLAATFLTRDAPLRVRFYCWLMFACTVIVSVGGNAVYAAWFIQRDSIATALDSWRYLPAAAVVGASLWPAFSAGALHLLIVVRRHMERIRDSVRHAAEVARRAAETAELRAQAERDAAAEVQEAEAALEARAVVLAAGGATVSDILTGLDLDESRRRAVERWTKPIRDALAQRQPAVAAKPATRRQGRPEGVTA